MYCGDNPIMRVDPSGMEWWEFWKWDWGKIFLIGAVVAGAIVVGVMTGGAAFAALGGAYVGVAIAAGVAAAVGWVAFCGLLANAVSYIDTEIYVLLNYDELELSPDDLDEFGEMTNKTPTVGWSREKKLKYIKFLKQNGKNENWSVGQMLREFEYHDGAYNFLTSFGLDQSNTFVHRAMHVDFEENQTFYTYILRGIGNFIF